MLPFSQTLQPIWGSPFSIVGGGQFNLVSSASATDPIATSTLINAGRHAAFRIPYNARFQVLTITVHASRAVDVVLSNNSVYPTVTNTSSFFLKSDHILACATSPTSCTHVIAHRCRVRISPSLSMPLFMISTLWRHHAAPARLTCRRRADTSTTSTTPTSTCSSAFMLASVIPTLT